MSTTHSTDHAVYKLFSALGRRMSFPQGIVAQSEGSQGARVQATAGMAFKDGAPVALAALSRLLPNFDAAASVAYAPVAGLPALREAWLKRMLALNPAARAEHVSKPVVSGGITHGIRLVLDLMLGEGEELISPNLFWENYRHIVETSLGGSLRTFEMFAPPEDKAEEKSGPEQFNIRGLTEAMEHSAARQKKILLLLNFPNNPTGYSMTARDMDAIRGAVLSFAERGIPVLVMCDDAYFGLFYSDDVFTQSAFAVFSGLHANVLAVKLDGVTKELFAWGLRVGFITFGNASFSAEVQTLLEEKLKGVLRASTTSSSRLSQSVALRMLGDPELDAQLQEQFAVLKERYEITKQAIHAAAAKYPNSGLHPYPCNSGYFISFRTERVPAETVRLHLLQKESIALIALDGLVRFTFSAINAEIIPGVIDALYRETQALASS